MGSGIDPKVDYAFKRVFGSEENRNVLQHLLNALLAESLARRLNDVQLLNPFSQKDAQDDRLSILDIKARDEAGREYLIEMQLFAQASFPERLLYYGARHYSQQLAEGEKYSRLRPVIVICFVNAVLFPEMPGYHSRFELIDPRHGGRFSDQFMIHVIELPKFLDSKQPFEKDVDRWTYFLRHGNEWDPATLPPFLSAPEFRQATGTLTMLAQSDSERELYEARLKYTRDEAAREDYATEKGRAEGRAEEARTLILRLGTRQWGAVPPEIAKSLEAFKSVDRLEELVDRVVSCSSWDEFVKAGL